MKLHAFLPSTRVLGIMALKAHLGLDFEVQSLDLSQGGQRMPDYLAKNPNSKMPMLEEAGFTLWESNAILVYLAAKSPQSGLWPPDLARQDLKTFGADIFAATATEYFAPYEAVHRQNVAAVLAAGNR